jgi:hypothetical protein
MWMLADKTVHDTEYVEMITLHEAEKLSFALLCRESKAGHHKTGWPRFCRRYNLS